MGARPIVNIPTPTMAYPLNGTPNDVIGGNNGVWTGTPAYTPVGGGRYAANMQSATRVVSTSPCLSGRVWSCVINYTPSALGANMVLLYQQAALGAAYVRFGISSTTIRMQIGASNRSTANLTETLQVGKRYQFIFEAYNFAGTISRGKLFFQGRELVLTSDVDFPDADTEVAPTGFNYASLPAYGLYDSIEFHNGVALTDAQAAELHVRSKAPVQNPAMIQLPIAARSPYGSPDGAWGFNGGEGFGDYAGTNDLTNAGLTLTAKGGFRNDGTAGKYAISPATWSNIENSPISYNFWAKHKYNAVGNFRCPFCIDAWNLGIGVLFQENDIRVLFYGKGATPYVSSYTLKLNAWNMVSFIYDGSIVKCFVNGVNVYTSAAGETLSAQTNKIVKLLYGNLTSTYNFTDEVRGFQIEKSAWDDSVIPMLYSAGVPENRANELFFTHNFSRDLSVNNVAITRIGGAKITRDGLLCDGASGGAYIADKIGTGDITIYTTIYPTGWGEGNAGYILDNGKFRINLAIGGQWLNVSSDGVSVATSANFGVVLNTPQRFCITRTAAGVVNIYKNAVLTGAANQDSGAPSVVGVTNLYFGNRAADDRTFAGLKSDTRINSGIDTAAQILADNARYGFI